MKTLNPFKTLALAFLIWNFTPLFANAEQVKSSIFDQFLATKVLNAELEIDLNQLNAKKKTNDFLPASFHFSDENGARQSWKIDVRVRGRFRRVTCDMPPLKLRFPKDELKAKGLKKHNSFKLVTHCLDSKEGDKNIFREYLAYQMYNLLTEKSLRTQLLKINYKDSASGESFTQYGFLIEDIDQLAERLDTKECDQCYGVPTDQFPQDQLQLHALFQYMIGNTDWSVRMSRNVKLLKSKKEEQYTIVPYDFDFSGLVDASYAIPNPDYAQKSIHQRIFLGTIAEEGDLETIIERFKLKKEAIYGLVQNFELLPRSDKKGMIKFLDSFYEDLDEPTIKASMVKAF